MKEQENLHLGHRERLLAKFMLNPDAFNDHEILELLLFYAVPRTDTNPLAHRLLKLFGNLDGVMNAEKEQLLAIHGVGEKTCAYLLALGQALKRIKNQSRKKVKLSSIFDTKEWLFNYYRDKEKENFIMIMLDGKYNLIAYSEFTDKNKHSVSAEIPEVVCAINVHKPKNIIISHNHPYGEVSPSTMDDFTTKKINIICELNDIVLLDHVIISKNKAYSYRETHRLDEIKEKATLNNLFKEIKTDK